MLYLIGLGLSDESDLTKKALERLKECDEVYIETYTNKWEGSLEKLEKEIRNKIVALAREKVESDFLMEHAKQGRVALLVPGDPLAATTHVQLLKDCKKAGVEAKVINNASILTSVGETGLSLYKFGRVTTLSHPSEGFAPKSPYEIIKKNKEAGLHTLVLLDIGEEPMTTKKGIEMLNGMDEDKIISDIIVGAKLGSDKQKIKYGSLNEITLDESPGFIIVPGDIDENEKEALEVLL